MGGYGSYLGFRIKLSDDPVSSTTPCVKIIYKRKMYLHSSLPMNFAFHLPTRTLLAYRKRRPRPKICTQSSLSACSSSLLSARLAGSPLFLPLTNQSLIGNNALRSRNSRGCSLLCKAKSPDFYRWICSPHAVTGVIGLALLTIQSILPTQFEVT
jgi:hypothetical protein